MKGPRRQMPYQLRLPMPRWDRDSLEGFLAELTGMDTSLTITDNVRSLLNARALGKGLAVRLHRMFLAAEEETLAELARYIRTGRGSTPLFWDFVRRNRALMRVPPRRVQSHRTEGEHHDLGPAFDELNSAYFGGALACHVTWGRRPARGRAKTRTLGTYCFDTNTIRISPTLDSPRVPRYYVMYVLYHEMVHAEMHRLGRASASRNGRRLVHPPEFRAIEQRYEHYERAMDFERRRAGR